jgi:hypothetical protein
MRARIFPIYLLKLLCSNNNEIYLGPIIVVAPGAHHAPQSFNVKHVSINYPIMWVPQRDGRYVLESVQKQFAEIASHWWLGAAITSPRLAPPVSAVQIRTLGDKFLLPAACIRQCQEDCSKATWRTTTNFPIAGSQIVPWKSLLIIRYLPDAHKINEKR